MVSIPYIQPLLNVKSPARGMHNTNTTPASALLFVFLFFTPLSPHNNFKLSAQPHSLHYPNTTQLSPTLFKSVSQST